MGVRPTVPSRFGTWVVPFGLVTGASVGMLLGVFVGAAAPGIILGAGLGLVVGAVSAVVAGTGVAEERPLLVVVALAVVTVGGVGVVLTWLR